MRGGSSHTSTLLAAMPTFGREEQARSSAASQPGSASASLLSSAIKSPRATAIPWLLAAQKPRFSGFRITRAPNSRSAISAEPSMDPLSTTMVSKIDVLLDGERGEALTQELLPVPVHNYHGYK